MQYLKKYNFFCVILLCTLSTACIDITGTQEGYVSDRDSCIRQSYSTLDVYFNDDTNQPDHDQKKSVYDNAFCECMKKYKWKVKGCPKPVSAASKKKDEGGE